jgi:NAD(P)H-dependent flavin oxidoreductase YrpB (nitropropane dioxygenase family)
VERKSTNLSFGAAISNYSRPAWGLSSQRLTASVSNYGGLGSFGAHGLKPEAIRNVIREIKALTPKPFAMNLWVSMEDEGALTSTEKAFHRSLAPLGVPGLICASEEETPWSKESIWHEVRGINLSRW